MEKLYSEIEILKTANIRKREVGKLNPSTFLLSSIEIIFFLKKKVQILCQYLQFQLPISDEKIPNSQ